MSRFCVTLYTFCLFGFLYIGKNRKKYIYLYEIVFNICLGILLNSWSSNYAKNLSKFESFRMVFKFDEKTNCGTYYNAKTAHMFFLTNYQMYYFRSIIFRHHFLILQYSNACNQSDATYFVLANHTKI